MLAHNLGRVLGRLRTSFKHRIVGRSLAALDVKREEVQEGDASVLARAEEIITRAIEHGRRGSLTVVPEMISVAATENCNLKCVMCPGHAGMDGPKLSTDEANMLFDSLVVEGAHFGSPKILDMTSGEPTLNPDLGIIYARFKELFPGSKISMISNGTIPVRGRIREAFEHADRIGLSMDGATQETYERIRKGSAWKNVIRNVKEVAEIKKIGVNCETLQIMMVVMDQNVHELPEMIRLAHSLGVPQVFAQASEVRTTPFNIEGQNVSLSLSKAKLAPIICEAKDEAERLGIQLTLTAHLEDALSQHVSSDHDIAAKKEVRESIPLSVAIKTCNVPWMHAPRISQNKDGIYPTTVCCHMPNTKAAGNLFARKELWGKSINEIYNSKFYWDIRGALMDGSLADDACKGCQFYRSTQWTATQLRELEAAVEAAEVS